MAVQHVPWEATETSSVQVVDGQFYVDGLEHIEFARKNWRGGGYEAFAVCKWCGADVKAGGRAGEEGILRWARGHQCSKPDAEFEVDEDKRLFR